MALPLPSNVENGSRCHANPHSKLSGLSLLLKFPSRESRIGVKGHVGLGGVVCHHVVGEGDQ